MKRVENLNAPSLAGWLMAAAAGFVAFLVSKIIGGFDWTPSVFFGLVVMVGAGLFLGMPWGAKVPEAGAEAAGHGAAAAAEAAPAAVKVADVPAAAAAAAPVKAAAVAEAPVAKPAAAAKAAAADKAAPKAAAKAEKAAPKAAAAKAEKAAPKAAAVKAEAAAKPAAKAAAPAAKAAAVADVAVAEAEGKKPAALKAPRKGVADDLKQIEGIGPALEKLCNELGIYHFDQIAKWGAAEVAWMDANLKGFRGRVTRDKWVAQAKLIGSVGLDEFLRRAKTNDY